jgi:FO synthase
MPVAHDTLPQSLLRDAAALTLSGHGAIVTYSPKVFIPLTRLCRDVCHYCTFATQPSKLRSPYLLLDEVLAIARSGKAAGCREALFTLGDQPEARYRAARRALDAMGYASTLDYVRAACAAVIAQTGLLPHINAGLMTADDYAMLRPVSASMGLMLETVSERLSEPGGPHHGSPRLRRRARRGCRLRPAY